MSRPGRPSPAGDPARDPPWPADDAPPGPGSSNARRPYPYNGAARPYPDTDPDGGSFTPPGEQRADRRARPEPGWPAEPPRAEQPRWADEPGPPDGPRWADEPSWVDGPEPDEPRWPAEPRWADEPEPDERYRPEPPDGRPPPVFPLLSTGTGPPPYREAYLDPPYPDWRTKGAQRWDGPTGAPVNGTYPGSRPAGARLPLPDLELPDLEPPDLEPPDLEPLDADPPTEILRRYVPAHEVLDREARDPRALRQERLREAGVLPPHEPRAVVRRRRARRRMLEWPFLVVFALVAAFGIRTFAVQTFYIPSASMHETLLEGDRVLVNKLSYRLHDVHRGDIVVFRRPPNFPVEDDDLIKRVVGLPGETVEARGGKVYVNRRPLQEPYVEAACHGTDDFPPIRVPAKDVWVMGDNRCDSSDSRVFGPIAERLLVGRAFVLAWPPGRIAWL